MVSRIRGANATVPRERRSSFLIADSIRSPISLRSPSAIRSMSSDSRRSGEVGARQCCAAEEEHIVCADRRDGGQCVRDDVVALHLRGIDCECELNREPLVFVKHSRHSGADTSLARALHSAGELPTIVSEVRLIIPDIAHLQFLLHLAHGVVRTPVPSDDVRELLCVRLGVRGCVPLLPSRLANPEEPGGREDRRASASGSSQAPSPSIVSTSTRSKRFMSLATKRILPPPYSVSGYPPVRGHRDGRRSDGPRERSPMTGGGEPPHESSVPRAETGDGDRQCCILERRLPRSRVSAVWWGRVDPPVDQLLQRSLVDQPSERTPRVQPSRSRSLDLTVRIGAPATARSTSMSSTCSPPWLIGSIRPEYVSHESNH